MTEFACFVVFVDVVIVFEHVGDVRRRREWPYSASLSYVCYLLIL